MFNNENTEKNQVTNATAGATTQGPTDASAAAAVTSSKQPTTPEQGNVNPELTNCDCTSVDNKELEKA